MPEGLGRSIVTARSQVGQLQVRPLELASTPEYDALRGLLDEALGTGYVSPAKLEAHRRRSEGRFAWLACDDDRVVGALLSRVLAEAEVQSFQALLADQGVELPVLVTGLLDIGVVAPTMRRRGVVQRLVAVSLTELGRLGCRQVLTVAWDSGSPDSAHGPARRAGFRVAGTLHDYWYGRSLAEGFACPNCGHPCRCSATLFVRSMTIEPGETAR